MDFGGGEYIFAQIIGLIGFLFYISAPYYKTRMQIQLMEAVGCGILCGHWYLMGFEVLMWGNVIWVYMILMSILREYDGRALFLIYMSYVLVAANAYIHWENTLLDYTALIGINLAVTCRLFRDVLKFRSYAFGGGVFSVLNCILAFSVPGIIFNSIFTFGHALGISKLLQERHGHVMPFMPRTALQPIRIRIRR